MGGWGWAVLASRRAPSPAALLPALLGWGETDSAAMESGAAGLAALFSGLPMIDADARVLAILSEGPEDA